MCLNLALIAKIRQIYTSPNAHQGAFNRGCFHHPVYPIRTLETLLECEYEGRFSNGDIIKIGK
jgi:hypothetical protein